MSNNRVDQLSFILSVMEMSSDPAVVLLATQSAYKEPCSSEDAYVLERMVPHCVKFMDSEWYLTV